MLPKPFFDNRIKRLFKYNAFYAIGFIIANGTKKLLINPFLAKNMGESLFGAFLIVMGIANLVASIPVSGIYQTIIREYSNFDEDIRDIFSRTGLFIVTGLALICFLVFYSSKSWLVHIFQNPDLEIFVGFLALYAFFYTIFTMGRTLLRINLKFKILSLMDASEGILLLLVIPLSFIFNAKGAAIGFFISSFVLALAMLYYLRDIFFKRPLFNLTCFKKIARISPLFTGSTVLSLLMHNIDRWFIGYFFTTIEVSYYFAATSVALLFIIPFSLLHSILFPLVSQKKHISELDKKDLTRYTRFMLLSVLIIIILGILVGDSLTRLLYTEEMTINSRTAYVILLLGQSINLLYILSRSFIDKFLNPVISIYTVLIFSTTNIFLDIILIPSYGINGAAIATALSLSVNGVVWFYIYITKILFGQDDGVGDVKNFILDLLYLKKAGK